jgi:hypothetical protein
VVVRDAMLWMGHRTPAGITSGITSFTFLRWRSSEASSSGGPFRPGGFDLIAEVTSKSTVSHSHLQRRIRLHHDIHLHVWLYLHVQLYLHVHLYVRISLQVHIYLHILGTPQESSSYDYFVSASSYFSFGCISTCT